MTTSVGRKAQQILQDALDVPEDERAAYLDRTCQGDPNLRREVDSLLAALERAGTFLEEPALVEGAQVVHERLDAHVAGRRIAGYVVERVIGRGGMGTVYLAQQTQPRRQVALKVLRAGLSSSSLRRFEYEAEILGRLDHPHVAKVFEAGTFEDGGERGLPYFAMEFVEGGVRSPPLPYEAGLELTPAAAPAELLRPRSRDARRARPREGRWCTATSSPTTSW